MANSFLPGQIPFVANIQQKQKPRIDTIKENGEYDIEAYRGVNIQVPGATTKDLFEAVANGTYDIAEYAKVKVEVPNPSTGTKDITANGNNIDVKDYAAVNVNVPNPSSGTLQITENGEGINVTNYAYVDVSVSGGGPELSSNYLYYTDDNGEIQTSESVELSSNEAIYYKDDYGQLQSETPESPNYNYYRYASGDYPRLQPVYFGASIYAYIGGCDILSEVSGLDSETEGHICVYNGTGSGGSVFEISNSEAGSFNLVYWYAGSELICESFDELEVGEDTTVTITSGSHNGTYKITRLS